MGTPNVLADEKTTLQAFLRYLRAAVIAKVTAVDEAHARREMVASGKSLLGLVKHLTVMELGWFSHAYAGQDPQATPDQQVTDSDTVTSVVAAYQVAAARSDEVVARCTDLDAPGVRTLRASAPAHPTLRWILVHLIEDTARHAGHADVLREQIDGVAGNWRGDLRW